MKKFLSRFGFLICLAAGYSAAQSGGSGTRITVQPGVEYFVDGQGFHGPTAFVWPVGSKHVLQVASPIQHDLVNKTTYVFGDWEWDGGTLPGGATVTITAGPPLTEVRGTFTVSYALSLDFFYCPDPSNCSSAGTVFVNTTPYTYNQDVFLAAGSVVQLIASPNPGYVFQGWAPGTNQAVNGLLDKVTMNGPTIVHAIFQPARRVNLATVPAGLQLYADHSLVTTPNTMEWGSETTHTLGVVSPQRDATGNWWAFSSWSDGGDLTHAYTVSADITTPTTVTATFVPAGVTDLHTSPAGLKLKIDGRDDWQIYNFTWGVGETHSIEAPAQQADSQGRLWAFASWSNGGARVQNFVVPQLDPVNGSHLTATYAPVAHLIVNSAVLSGGTVKVDGADCTIPCDVQRPVGSVVKVSAPASIPLGDNSRGDFDGWPGSGSFATDWALTLGPDPVNLNLTYHAMNRLTAASNPPEGASWRMDPASSDGFYDAQSSVAITVTPQAGFRFRNFTGDLGGSAPAGTVRMNAPRWVNAIMEKAPYIAPSGVSNGAAATPRNVVAPGSIVSVFGASLASDLAIGPDTPMVQALAGVTVRAGDRLMPIYFVSPTQVNVQLPDDFAQGDSTVTVSCEGLADVQAQFTVVRNAPGLFQTTANGQNFAVAFHEDGSPVTVDSPARKGELLTAWGTGFGPAGLPRPMGFAIPASPAYRIVDTVTVAGDVSISAENAFAVPGKVGLDAVQFRLGDGVPAASNVSIHLTINGQDSNTVLIPVQ
jgi:uncharacterized protein (TIGR03437 family)